MRDVAHGEDVTITADLVINAAGAWAGRIAALAGVEVKIIPGKGTMVAMNHRIVNTVLNRCKMPSDGDIIVPIHTVAVIGTTDEKVSDPDRLRIEPWEVALMLAEGDKLVPGISQARVLRAWAGVRPLYQEGFAGESRDATRALTLLDHRRPRRRRRAAHHHRRQVDHLPAHGRNHDGPGVRPVGHAPPVHHRHAPRSPASSRAITGSATGCTKSKNTGSKAELDLRVRIGHPRHAGAGRPPQPHRHAGRSAPRRAAGHGAMSRRLLHLSRRRRPPRVRNSAPLDRRGCARRPGTWQPCSHPPTILTADATGPGPDFNANLLLRDFLQERWKGVTPILWGRQLKQERLDELIYLGLMNADHLPADDAVSPLTDFYRDAPLPTTPEDDHA